MSMVLFNNELIASGQQGTLLSNRGFLYGDGFFETLTIRQSRIYFIEDHLARANKAMHALMLECSFNTSHQLLLLIKKLWEANGKPEYATLKWMVWRDAEGLYEPQHNKSCHLLELKPFREAVARKKNTGFAQEVSNRLTPYSGFKSLSSLHYVLAGLEKKRAAWDEIILLDQQGNISEALSSSVFWIDQDKLYTPSLQTGCIDGITRKQLISLCQAWHVPIQELAEKGNRIPSSATVFTGNISGLSIIESIEGQAFKTDDPLLKRLQDALFSTTFSQSLETTN